MCYRLTIFGFSCLHWNPTSLKTPSSGTSKCLPQCSNFCFSITIYSISFIKVSIKNEVYRSVIEKICQFSVRDINHDSPSVRMMVVKKIYFVIQNHFSKTYRFVFSIKFSIRSLLSAVNLSIGERSIFSLHQDS